MRLEHRPGSAIIISLALLALGGAILAGSAATARAAERSARTMEATVAVESEARRSLAQFMSEWGAAEDSLAIGASLSRTIGPREQGPGMIPITTGMRLQRISIALFALDADCLAGPDDTPLARRRYLLLMERAPASDSLAPVAPPVPISRWSLSDLY